MERYDRHTLEEHTGGSSSLVLSSIEEDDLYGHLSSAFLIP